MKKSQLNAKLKNLKTIRQLNFLLATNLPLKSILHEGLEVDMIYFDINADIVRYTYKKSNIEGKCKINKLHHYLMF